MSRSANWNANVGHKGVKPEADEKVDGVEAEASDLIRGMCGEAMLENENGEHLGPGRDGDSDAASIGLPEDDQGEVVAGAVLARVVEKSAAGETATVEGLSTVLFSEHAVAEARARLGHCASGVREAAARYIEKAAPPGDAPTAKALLLCLEDEECAGVQRAVLDALGRTGEVQGPGAVAAATGAVAYVGEAGDGVGPAALAALRRLAGRGASAEVCNAAAARIVNEEEPCPAEIRVALLDLLGSVASASGDATLEKTALETAVHIIKSKGPSRERRAGIQIMQRTAPTGDQTMVALLIDNLEDSDEDLRKAAADALCEIGGARRLLQELARNLNTTSVTRRDAALQVLRRLQVEAKDQVVRQVIGQAIFRGNQAARAGGEVIPAIYSRLQAEEEKRTSVAEQGQAP